MVSFSHTPYNSALRCIQAQDKLLGRIMQEGDFFQNIEDNSFSSNLDQWVNDYHKSVQQPDLDK